MKPELAKNLALKVSQTIKEWDPYGYADIVDGYGSEELLVEHTVKEMLETPEVVINYLLEVMDCMLDALF